MALFGADSKIETAHVGALLLAEYLGEFRALYKGLSKKKGS